MIAISLILAALLAMYFGGWPWALIFGAAVLACYRALPSPHSLLLFAAASAFWLIAFSISGDRRLFFPFTIQFAMQLYTLNESRVFSSSMLIALFAIIRLAQNATLIVLLVELVVAGVAIALSAYYFRNGTPTTYRRMIAAILASVLAFAGLIF